MLIGMGLSGCCLFAMVSVLAGLMLSAELRTEEVSFAPGASSVAVTGKVSGEDAMHYTVRAQKGQFLKVSLRPDNLSANYNIYVPGKGPGEEALYVSATGGHEYSGQLYMDGDHLITVFLIRAAARRNETANYELVVQVTDEDTPLPPVDGADSAIVADDPWSRVEMVDKPHAPLLEGQATLPATIGKNPVGIASAVLSNQLTGIISEAKAAFDTMENPTEVMVSVTERGILDDDLLGVRHAITMDRNKNKEWRITGYQRGELRRKHLR